MLSLLISLLILFLIAAIGYWIISIAPAPPMLKNIAYVVGGVILLLILLALLTGVVSVPRLALS